jgi:hypothetical protein
LSARLVLLACGLAAAAAAPTSFSCAASTVTVKAGDAPLEVCVVNSTTGSAAVTLQWYTASNIKSPDGTGGEAARGAPVEGGRWARDVPFPGDTSCPAASAELDREGV